MATLKSLIPTKPWEGNRKELDKIDKALKYASAVATALEPHLKQHEAAIERMEADLKLKKDHWKKS